MSSADELLAFAAIACVSPHAMKMKMDGSVVSIFASPLLL
jgi:hypothetical protein